MARVCAALSAMAAFAAPVLAHPHVWVEARAEVLFGKDGKVDAIRNAWVFDEMYSAFAVQGLEKGGKLATTADLATLAKSNVDDLKEYDYFTYAKAAGQKVKFGAPTDYSLEERPDKRVVLHFTLPLAEPTKTGRFMSVQIYDPTYFVDFELAPKDPLELAGAPAGCSKSVLGANPRVVADAGKGAADTGGPAMTQAAMSMGAKTGGP